MMRIFIFFVVQFVQQHFDRGTGGHDNRFAFQVSKIFDIARLRQQAGAYNEDSVRESGLFLTLEVVGWLNHIQNQMCRFAAEEYGSVK